MIEPPDPSVTLAPQQMMRAFVDVCRERPDDVALGDPRRTVTYGELEQFVGGMAARLAELDQHPVVVFADRSVESVMACIAVLWAGRCMVPLDAAEPAARLRMILGRLGECNLIDPTGTVHGPIEGRPVLDVRHPVLQRFDPVACHPDSPAVLFFTSGSTGEPKGVMRTVAQQDLLFRNRQGPLELGGTHLATFSPMHFVAGFGSCIIGPATGVAATLLDLSRMTFDEVADRIDRDGMDMLLITPSLVHSMAAALDGRRRLKGLRWVAGFGELMDWHEVDLIRRLAADEVFVRIAYGASESLGGAVIHNTITADMPLGEGPVPLGTPIDGSRVRFDPVEGSDTLREVVLVREVIDGYWNDPAMTAQRFGMDEHGVRFWRTGDLVRLDDQGIVHLSGRIDDMVKINGRLVEPAEAQQVLRAVPGISHAVLLPRHLPNGRSQFVAHLELDPEVIPQPTPESVRAVLRRDLPAHLVPAVLMRHDPMPLTDRGKVDRGALRRMEVHPWRTTTHGDEHDSLVAGISGLAASLLDIPDLGADDDLWDMGCDSLGAIELIESLRSVHGAELEPNDLIAAPTPRLLAARMRQASKGTRSPTVVVHPEGHHPPIALIAGGGGPAVQYHPLASAFGPDQPVIIYEQLGLHQRWARDRGAGAQAKRCVADLRRRQPEGPYRLMGHSYGGLVAHEMARLLEADGQRAAVVIIDTAQERRAQPGVPTTRRSQSRAYLALYRQYHGVRSVLSRPGTAKRYHQMFQRTALHERHHQPGLVQGPMLVVGTVESAGRLGWDDQPNRTTFVVDGTHLSIVQPPLASDVAAAAAATFALLDDLP